MLRRATIIFLTACVLGGVYEFALRDKALFSSTHELRVAAPGWMLSEFKLHDHVERFQRQHPEMVVRLFQAPTDYQANLILQSSLGELPYDVVLTPSNYDMYMFHKRGLALPLDTLVPEKYWDDIFPGMLDVCRFGGNLIALPFMAEVEVLNYRRDRLEEAGITSPPRTWAEFENCARLLTSDKMHRQGISFIIGNKVFFAQNGYLPLLRSFGGSTVDPDGHLDMSTSAALEVFRTVKRWQRGGLISMGSLNKDGGPDDFKSGVTSLFPNWQSRGFWAVRQNKELENAVAWAPLPESDRVGSLFCLYGAVILQGTKVEKEAVAFVTEVMNGYAQKDIVGAGKLTPLRSLYVKGSVPDWMIEVSKTLANSYAAPESDMFVEVADFLAAALQDYLASDSDDPAPFLEQADKLVREGVYAKRGGRETAW